MSISTFLINTGSERATMSIAITGNTVNGTQVSVSRKGIENLHKVVDMGKAFNASSTALEESLTNRLKGFPNGEEVLTFLNSNNTTVTDYVNQAISILSNSKIKEPTERAKKGDGFKTKQTKFAISTAAKLACRFATASSDGVITKEMLLDGFNSALETFKDLDTDTVITAAMKIAEGRGVDNLGHIRLRGDSVEDSID